MPMDGRVTFQSSRLALDFLAATAFEFERACRIEGLAELMFLKSTHGRKGNLLIPITAPHWRLAVTESFALPA
jgi:hypothetical protein